MFFFSSFRSEETAPSLAASQNLLQNKRTGAQRTSRSAHPQPSASWTCTGASAPSSRHRAPGHPGDISSFLKKLTWHIGSCRESSNLVFNGSSHFKAVSALLLTKGVRRPACPAGPHPSWLPLVIRVQKVHLNPSQMGRSSRWPTWTTECPARICSRCCTTPSPVMDGYGQLQCYRCFICHL